MPSLKSALRRSVGSSRSSGLLYPAQDVERAIAMSEASAHLARLQSRSYKFMTTRESLLSRGPVVVSYPVEKTFERKKYVKNSQFDRSVLLPFVQQLSVDRSVDVSSYGSGSYLFPGTSVVGQTQSSEIFRRLRRQVERSVVDRVSKVIPTLSEDDQIRIASKVCIEREERRQVMAAKGYMGKPHDIPHYTSESAINCAEILKKIRYRR